jgi:hypothetical protein
MSYQAEGKILDDEYNAFVSNSSSPFGYNHFAGTGSGQYGLGQTHITTVGAGEKVLASQWNTLFTGVGNIANHTNDSLTASSSQQASAGDTIAIRSALVTDLATLAASVAGGCTSAADGLTLSSALQTANSSSTWTGSHISELSATFANADKMRHFFNGGGKIRIDTARTGNGNTGGSANDKDNSWTSIHSAVGNIDIGSLTSTRSGSGETLTTDGLALGFHDLTTSYQTIIKITESSSPYTSNYLEVEAKLDAAVGSAVTITVKISAVDGAADTTYTSGNTSGVDATPDRNGQHRHRLFSIDVNTADGLATGHAPASTATTSNNTT